MPDNLAQNVGSSAISPATCPSPVNGEAADAPSIDVPLQNLLDRANYNLTVSSDRVNAFSSAMGITPDNSDPDQLTEAAGKMRDTIATVDATGNKLDMARRVVISGAATGAGSGNLLELISKDGDDARPLLAIGSGEHSAIYASGGSAVDAGQGFSKGSGLHAASENSNSALFSQANGTGWAAELHGSAGGGGLRLTSTKNGVYAIDLEALNALVSGGIRVRLPPGQLMPAMRAEGYLQLTANGEPVNTLQGQRNTLYAANIVKAWAFVKQDTLESSFGISGITFPNFGEVDLQFASPFDSSNIAVLLTVNGNGSSPPIRIEQASLSDSFVRIRIKDAFSATTLSRSDALFSVAILGYQ